MEVESQVALKERKKKKAKISQREIHLSLSKMDSDSVKLCMQNN